MIWRWINLQPLLIALVLLAPTLSLSAYVHAAVELIAIGDADRLEPRFAGIEKEIHLLLDGEKMGSTVSVRHHVIPSSLSPDRIRSEVRKLAKSHPTSLWVALDPLSAQELGASRVIAAPRTSEVIRDISEDLRSFREIVPFSSVSVLADNSFIQGVKDLRKKVERLQEELSLRITLEPLPGPRAEAVYFSPLFDLPRAQSASLIRDLTKRKVPTFSSHAAGLSQEGVLAGKVNDPEDPSGIREARRIALDVQHVLLGTPRATALSLPVSYRLAINLDTARLIGVDPTFDVLRNATILGTATEPGKYDETPASPREIVEEAIKNNLNLASSRLGTESLRHEVGVARADLLPKVDLSLSYFRVDNNLSQASSGLIPEFVYSGTALIRQNLFSEPIWASLSTKTHQADASRESTRQTELDIVQAALNAYAQVLLARQQVRQQQDNIARTRANLAIARSKLAAGASSRSDVYRWESQLARAESSLQSAEASAKIAEISINRILHRPLDQPVSLQEIGFDHPEFWVSDARLRNRFNTAEGFRALEAFLVSESLRNSPEVKNLDQQLAAAARSVGSDKAKFVLPSLTADALVTHTFNANMPGALGPSVSPVPLAFSALDSTQWALSLNLAYNLFNGLGDLAKLREDAEKLHQLEVTRASAREGIEQALRQAMQRVRAAYVSIALEQTSAKSAGQNYELVRRAYVRGAQSITDLTDAQNNAFNADVGASTSVYSFFQAYFNMERALGTFDVMQTEQERADFTSRLALLEKK